MLFIENLLRSFRKNHLVRAFGGCWCEERLQEWSARGVLHAIREGGIEIIKFTNGLQGNRINGPEPFWNAVFRSSTKSLRQHVKCFEAVYFNSAKPHEGLLKSSWTQLYRVRLEQSLFSRSLQPRYRNMQWVGQVWWRILSSLT